MIRDTRKINIETNFFQDDEFYSLNPQQDTLHSTLMTKDKAAIFFYNILDTFRLQRIIHAFGLFVNNVNAHIRKYSSKQIFINNKNHNSKLQSNINRNYKNSIKRNQELDDQLRVFKYNDLQRNQRKALSLNAKSVKNSSYLRESRKRILQSINKTFNNESTYQNKTQIQKKAKFVNNKIEPQLQKNLNISLENKTQQNIQIRNRLQKIEKLMKNIRREKDKKQTVIVHKELVAQLPKRQKNYKRILDFMEELKSLRTQIHQIKQINQQILHHSRQRSIKSSKIGTKSQKQVNINTLPYKDIKRSQFLQNYAHKQNNKQISPIYRRHERYEKDSKRQNMKISVTSQKSYQGQKRQLSINNQTNLSILPQRKNYVDVKKTAQQFRNTTNSIKNIQLKFQQKSNKKNIRQIYENPKQRVISQGRLKPQNSLENQIKNKQLSFQEASPYFAINDQGLKRQQQTLDLNFIKSQLQTYNNYQYKNNYDIASKYHTNNQNNLPNDIKNQKTKINYKTSAWYNQYGSPRFNPINNINIQPRLNENNQIKINRDVVSFSIENDDIQKQVSKANKIQGFGIDRLNQLTDKISYSNFNSARTSNHSKQEDTMQETNKYQNFNKYNERDPVYISKQSPTYNKKQPNYRQINSDYTNPALLKRLNINTYPKTNPDIPWYDNSNNNINYYKTKQNYQYQQSYNTNPKIQSSYHMHQIDNRNKQKIVSQKSIQDNHSYNSYTYSNNSSNTSMAKLEQEYEDIINSPAQQYPKYQIDPKFNKYQGNNQTNKYDKYNKLNKYVSNNHQLSGQHNNQQQYGAYDRRIFNTQNIENSSYGLKNSYSYQQIYEDYIKNR